jgi:hypothetical protein
MSSEKFLWVCELNKDQPTKVWKANDLMEFEDDDDKDFVINSLILKTAVLGKAVDGERNLVAIKTIGYQNKEFEQPIFSLTLGRTDMVSGLDLTLASDHNPTVEFKLVDGTGPVYITCTHMVEMPSADEQQTILTTSDGDLEEDIEDDIADDEVVEGDKKRTSLKNGHALKNGKLNGTNGHNGTNGVKVDADMEEKPTKRRRN